MSGFVETKKRLAQSRRLQAAGQELQFFHFPISGNDLNCVPHQPHRIQISTSDNRAIARFSMGGQVYQFVTSMQTDFHLHHFRKILSG
jgi:hypothetical protein